MNNSVFEKSSMIWHKGSYSENEYAEFHEKISWNGGSALVRLSVCGDYTLFVNGKYAASNQYGDFEYYKIYDEIDITPFLDKGENNISFLVWYFGRSGMRYLTETPGLIYEIFLDGNIVAFSSESTFSRKSKAYISGSDKKISAQLGYSFAYDAASEDRWLYGELQGFDFSCVMEHSSIFYKRPVPKHNVESIRTGTITKADNRYIVDLGSEIVGLCSFSLVTEKAQKINVSYGELLENGHVKRFIGDRDFSFDYTAKPGLNEYTNYMLRLACRYIEIESDYPVDINYVGILLQVYPVREKAVSVEKELDKSIYDICLNTLRLCMMEHYVDCPWREQCLYAFDSRNQMLAGYIAFENGNFDYARANLLLMSKDTKSDNIMSICYPSGEALTIPSFSLYYILAVKEYLDYSSDLSLASEVFDKMTGILKAFTDNAEDGLICHFAGSNRWNFYDWSEYADGVPREKDTVSPDFLINAITVIALEAYDDICRKLSVTNAYAGIADSVRKAARKRYLNEDTGLFYISGRDERPTELANSLAVLSGIAEGDIAVKICEKLSHNELISCSLSMKTFKYDAMLSCDRDKYKDDVLNEIRHSYSIMLDAGSDTVWETAEGAAAFDNAGSLCHGWSAIPIYYFDLLK